MNNKEKQKKFYDKNGFIKITDFFSQAEISQLKKIVNEIEVLKPEKNKQMIYKDYHKKKLLLTRTENFYDHNLKMRNFLTKKKIVNLLSNLIGSKPSLFKDKINWKYPGANGFEPHQDAQVWENLYKNNLAQVSSS